MKKIIELQKEIDKITKRLEGLYGLQHLDIKGWMMSCSYGDSTLTCFEWDDHAKISRQCTTVSVDTNEEFMRLKNIEKREKEHLERVAQIYRKSLL